MRIRKQLRAKSIRQRAKQKEIVRAKLRLCCVEMLIEKFEIRILIFVPRAYWRFLLRRL